MKIFIETERLILREIVEADLEGMYALDADPDVHTYLGNQPIRTREQAKHIIRHIRQQYVDNGIGRWAIIDKKTNDFIGWSGLKYETGLRSSLNYYDLGYRLRKEYWGKGIATETAIESIRYGFTKMNLKEIGAAANIHHVASNKILKKVGLKFIDTFEYDGEPHNWYNLKRSDWIEE